MYYHLRNLIRSAHNPRIWREQLPEMKYDTWVQAKRVVLVVRLGNFSGGDRPTILQNKVWWVEISLFLKNISGEIHVCQVQKVISLLLIGPPPPIHHNSFAQKRTTGFRVLFCKKYCTTECIQFSLYFIQHCKFGASALVIFFWRESCCTLFNLVYSDKRQCNIDTQGPRIHDLLTCCPGVMFWELVIIFWDLCRSPSGMPNVAKLYFPLKLLPLQECWHNCLSLPPSLQWTIPFCVWRTKRNKSKW